MRARTLLIVTLVAALSSIAGATESHLGTFRGTQHKTDTVTNRATSKPMVFKEQHPETVSLVRLPGNRLQVSRGKKWTQIFRVVGQSSPSKGVVELSLERPTEGPDAQANLDNLNPHRLLRWIGKWNRMSGTGKVTLYEGKGLVWENQGEGRIRIGFSKRGMAWDEIFTGEK